MKLENYSMYLPAYTIGEQAYEKAPAICAQYGTKAAVIGGHRALAAAGSRITAAFAGSAVTLSDPLWYGGEASYENVDMLAAAEAVQQADMLFAVGGGKAIDTCKCLSEKTGKPVFSFPTIASTCAATTAVSIMYRPDGVVIGPHFYDAPPVHCFICTPVIAEAPQKYMWAGMGDTYAKYFESTVSSRGEDLVHYHALGVNISRMSLDPILQYGAQAMQDNAAGQSSYALEQVVLSIIVTTGIASILLTKEHIIDYNTGLAHAIYYALTAYPHIEARHLHGEVVAYGITILLLVDGDEAGFRQMYDFNRAVGLPVKLADLELTPAQLDDLIPRVLQMKDIDHNPYVITEQMLREAFARSEALADACI